jgi:hypothetical protein
VSIFHINKIGLSSITYENGNYFLHLYAYTKKSYPIGKILVTFDVRRNHIDFVPTYFSGQLDEAGKKLFLDESLVAPFAMFEDEKEAFFNENWIVPKLNQFFDVIKKIDSISSFKGISETLIEENVINFKLYDVNHLLFFIDESELYVLDDVQKMYIKVNSIPFYEDILSHVKQPRHHV